MLFSWQDIVVFIVVAATASYLIMRILHIGPWKQKPPCGTCGTTAAEQSQPNLTNINSLEDSHPERQ